MVLFTSFCTLACTIPKVSDDQKKPEISVANGKRISNKEYVFNLFCKNYVACAHGRFSPSLSRCPPLNPTCTKLYSILIRHGHASVCIAVGMASWTRVLV